MAGAPPLTRGHKVAGLVRQVLAGRDRRLVVLNSFRGKYSDSPRAIAEELHRRGSDLTQAWVADGAAVFPEDTALLPVAAGPYFTAVGRAGFVVSNAVMPAMLPRPGVTYLQTWHGTPLKRIGFDNARFAAKQQDLRKVARDYRQWDFLISQNSYSSEIFRRAFRFDGPILETGYPRNDVLRSEQAGARAEEVRQALGIAPEMRVVLYAPTFRDADVDGTGRNVFRMPLDLERMRAALGKDTVVLLRLHYWVAQQLADLPPGFCVDVSGYGDIRDLYLVADVLVTDYSSTMFDFAVTGRPIVLFVHDLDDYREHDRGFYFDITQQAPGPLCRTTDELIGVLCGVPDVVREHAADYTSFVEKFCPYDDGKAASRVVDAVFPAA